MLSSLEAIVIVKQCIHAVSGEENVTVDKKLNEVGIGNDSRIKQLRATIVHEEAGVKSKKHTLRTEELSEIGPATLVADVSQTVREKAKPED